MRTKFSLFILLSLLIRPALSQTVKIGSATAHPGDTVTLNVTLDSGVTGACGFTLWIDFSTDLSVPSSPTMGGLFAGSLTQNVTVGSVKISYAGANPSNGPGSLASVPFLIPANATNGTVYNLTLSKAEIYDSNGSTMATSSQNGAITVSVPDNTAPTTTLSLSPVAPNANGWFNQDVTATLTATDNSGGWGVSQIVYSVDGGADVSVNGSSTTVSLTTDGSHVLKYKAIDAANNVEAQGSSTIKIDKTLPTITATATSGGAPYSTGSWTGNDVIVTFACADGGSGVDTLTSPLTVSAEGANQTRSGTCVDSAGNSASVDFTPINIDKTLPVTTATVLPAAPDGSNGWYKSDVSVSLSAAEPNGSVTLSYALDGTNQPSVQGNPATATVAITQDGAHVLTYYATNQSGVKEATHSLTINLDKILPSITAAATSGGAPYSTGSWTDNDVIVTFTCSDGGSGVDTLTSPVTVSAEGANQTRSGTCVDRAGNSASVDFTPINIDKTLPTATFGSPSPAPNANGWNNANVSISFTTDDNLSGVAASNPASPLVLTTEGVSVTGSVTVTDKAGNSASPVTPAVKIDKTLPSISVSATSGGQSYASGNWASDDVIITFACTDGGSGVDALTSPVTVSAEGSHGPFTGTCVDRAGNSASINFTQVNIDKTAPITTPTLLPASPDGLNGWYKSDVSISLSATASNGTATLFYSVDGTDQPTVQGSPATTTLSLTHDGTHVLTYYATNQSGVKEATHTLTIKIDKTLPTITATAAASGLAYKSGNWTNQNVIVTFACTDNGSDVNTFTSPMTVSGEGSNQTATGSCTDKAGNSASYAFTGIDIDKTLPTVKFGTPSPAPNANGWYNANVSIPFTTDDNLSGVATSNPASPLVLTTEGSSVTGSVSITDKAGNATAFATSAVKIDKTAPISASSQSDSSGVVTITLSAADTGGSGVQSISYSVNGGTLQIYANPISFAIPGTWVLRYYATDLAGNVEATHTNTIDKTKPTITATATSGGATYHSGDWTNKDVIVTFACTDDTSGISSITSPTSVSSEGANQTITGTCSDNAGNSASFTFTGIDIDKTLPTATFGSPSPAPNANGWNNTDVSFSFTTADSLSGVASSSPASPLILSTEGSSVTGFVSVTDKAGNSASPASPAVKIDKTPPTIAAVVTDLAAGGSTIALTASDSGSGVSQTLYSLDGATEASYSSPITVSVAGSHTIKYHATDKAGNVGDTGTSNFTVITDRTPPTILATATLVGGGSYGSGQWTTRAVTVTFTCTDSGSGVASVSPPITIDQEGAGQSAYGTCADNVGNTVNTTFTGINIDRSSPQTTAVAAEGEDGTPQVTLSSTDAISGVSATHYRLDYGLDTTYVSPIEIADAGTHHVDYWAVDKAGNAEDIQGLNLSLPTLISPIKDVIVTENPPTFVWNAIDGATLYEVQWSQDSQFGAANTQGATTTKTSLKLSTALDTGRWRWRMKADVPDGIGFYATGIFQISPTVDTGVSEILLEDFESIVDWDSAGVDLTPSSNFHGGTKGMRLDWNEAIADVVVDDPTGRPLPKGSDGANPTDAFLWVYPEQASTAVVQAIFEATPKTGAKTRVSYPLDLSSPNQWTKQIFDLTKNSFNASGNTLRFVSISASGDSIPKPFVVDDLGANYAISTTPPVTTLGDLTGDGKITIADVTLALRMVLKLITPTSDQLAILDVNKDGKVNIGDVTIMLEVAVGLRTL